MSKTVEQKILVSVQEGAYDIRTKARVVDGKVEVDISYNLQTEENNYEEYFSLVEASKLSLDDVLKIEKQAKEQDEKQTEEQADFLKRVKHHIEFEEMKDFKAPRIDPSVDEETKEIYYKPGSKPGVGYSPRWWNENAKKAMPGLRHGLTYERDIFLFTLIKRGLATLEQVCDHSEEIGHYWDSENAKHDFEKTGSRPLGEFFDLANTCKITAKDKEASGFSLDGGDCDNFGDFYPLADCGGNCYPNDDCYFSVGWLVL